MIATTISNFRKDIKSYLDRVTDGFETLIIQRNKGADIVVMSLDEYNALMATRHELSSAKNEARLDAAIKKLSQDAGQSQELIEP
jgi:antitoxin YefM